MLLKADSGRWSASQPIARGTGRFGRTALALCCLGLSAAFGFSGCRSSEAPRIPLIPVATVSTTPMVTGSTTLVAAGGDAEAKPVAAAKRMTPEPFDGDRAYEILKKQCEFGVRPLGTDEHEKTKDYLIAEMQKYADAVVTQKFNYHNLPVTNVIGVFYPAGEKKPAARPILMMAHWDTRPIADGPYSDKVDLGYEYGPKGWSPTAPILGANDAGSGVAVLLEMARLFKDHKPAAGVLLLLDDGEDYGDFQANNDMGDGVELGSRYFAEHYKETPAFGRPLYGILLDMVGGKGATFPRENSSQLYAGNINDKVYGVAQTLHYKDVFLSSEHQDVNDDHIAINKAGIPMIDIIHPLPSGMNDANAYHFWHTQQDTADKCSPKTLKIVGDVVTEVLYREPK